jgi:hypothetical protein
MYRPITRSLLASFIEYAAKGCVTPLEWHRFIVGHYHDEEMENARRECARVFGYSKPFRLSHMEEPRPLSQMEMNALFKLASELRRKDIGDPT